MRKLFLSLATVAALALSACATTQNAQSTTPASVTQETSTEAQASTEQSTEQVSGDTFVYTDSLGRAVTLDKQIDKVAITGPMAQIYVYALAPEKLVGISREWDKGAEAYIPEEYMNYPILGQIYGGKGEMNKEEIVLAAPQVIIDIGEEKKDMKADLDALQEQLNIPIVHINADMGNAAEVFLSLGEVIQEQEKAQEYATFVGDMLTGVNATLDKVGENKKKIIYILGEEGKNIIAQGSYHSEIFDLVAENIAVVDEPSSKGTGNEVDMEYILGLTPDVVLFDPAGMYDKVANDAAWANLTAVKDGNYYESPHAVYNWLGFPPSVQRYLGMVWLAEILYPTESEADLKATTMEFYDKFYHVALTDEQYNEIVKNSLPK